MADIFVSYANEDRDRARTLAAAFEKKGWSVFWDRTIPIGKTWRQVIDNALRETRCVVVLWSKYSIDSDWVQEEADEGRERNVLIPVSIDGVRPPIGFRSIQASDLSDWDGSEVFPAYQRLIVDIRAMLGPSPADVDKQAKRKAEEVAARKKVKPEDKRKGEEERASRNAETEENFRREKDARKKPEAAADVKRNSEQASRSELSLRTRNKPFGMMIAAFAVLVVGGIGAAVYFTSQPPETEKGKSSEIARNTTPEPLTESIQSPRGKQQMDSGEPQAVTVEPVDKHLSDSISGDDSSTSRTLHTENVYLVRYPGDGCFYAVKILEAQGDNYRIRFPFGLATIVSASDVRTARHQASDLRLGATAFVPAARDTSQQQGYVSYKAATIEDILEEKLHVRFKQDKACRVDQILVAVPPSDVLVELR